MHAHCYACKEWLSEDDPLHEEPNLGCQAKERNVTSEYISEAKEYVDDAIVKKVFLNCWKKLELGFVNVDDLLDQMKYREHVESFIPDIQDLSPIQDKKRPFGMDLGPNSEEEKEVVKKKKTTDELVESVSDLIKIDTKLKKKQEEK